MILIYAVLLTLILGLGTWVFRQWAHQAGSVRARQVLSRSIMLITAVVLVIVLLRAGATLLALAVALLPVLQRLLPTLMMLAPALLRWYQRGKHSRTHQDPTRHRPQHSTVTTQFLVMTLNHADGRMTGEVLKGRYQGTVLSQLNLTELFDLLSECQADPQSSAVLQAYLDREHPQWRQAQHSADEPFTDFGADAQSDQAMSSVEARAILGVDADASREDIIHAHRRLMQKFHPDRGGNDFLAAKINRAKSVLLRDF